MQSAKIAIFSASNSSNNFLLNKNCKTFIKPEMLEIRVGDEIAGPKKINEKIELQVAES